MRDLKSNVIVKNTIDPANVTSTATGVGIDLKGSNAALVQLCVGTVTNVHTPKVQESDALSSGYTDVAAADLSDALVALVSDTNQSTNYTGQKRYIRVVNTVTGGGAELCGAVVLGNVDLTPAS